VHGSTLPDDAFATSAAAGPRIGPVPDRGVDSVIGHRRRSVSPCWGNHEETDATMGMRRTPEHASGDARRSNGGDGGTRISRRSAVGVHSLVPAHNWSATPAPPASPTSHDCGVLPVRRGYSSSGAGSAGGHKDPLVGQVVVAAVRLQEHVAQREPRSFTMKGRSRQLARGSSRARGNLAFRVLTTGCGGLGLHRAKLAQRDGLDTRCAASSSPDHASGRPFESTPPPSELRAMFARWVGRQQRAGPSLPDSPRFIRFHARKPLDVD
jgi:hypothetical protein